MGLFNSLIANAPCPICDTTLEKEIQFKHGAVRQYQYRIGDELRLVDGALSTPGKVQVDGITACSVCQTPSLLSKIVIDAGVITAVSILPIVDIPPRKQDKPEPRHGRTKSKRTLKE